MKRGQVTLFIIIGLILLLAMTLLLYYRTTYRERFTPYAEQVATEVLPIKQFVNKCLEQTAKRAITTLARQGGIINTSLLASNQVEPTEGDALMAAKSWTVPYWWHLKSKNSCSARCEFDEYFPLLHKEDGSPNAESQLATAISEQLTVCTGKFRDFPAARVNEKHPTIEVFIADDAVHVNALYPLEVAIGEKQHAVSRFYAKLDVNLPQLYNTAKAIAQEEAKQRFLELQAMELVTAYSGLNRKKLPPVSETLFFPKPLFWLTGEVKDTLQNILAANMHLLRMRGAVNVLHKKIDESLPYSAVLSRLYESFIIPIAKNIPYQTHFQYFPEWSIYISLSDKGGVILPEQASPQILPVPLVVQRYSTVYDFSFPVLVELYDQQAFDGNGLSFFFAMEGNVRANGAMNITSDQLETAEGDEGMLCDVLNLNTNITINVRDELGAPVHDALVSFNAGDTCLIGETNAQGKLTAYFPAAIGVLSVMAPNMISTALPLTVMLDMPSTQDVIITASGNMLVSIKTRELVHDAGDAKWHISKEGLLGEDDNAIVTFERDGYQKIARFSKESLKQEVELSTGTYNVRIISMQDINITLLPKKQCFETSGWLGIAQQEQCITIPEEPMTIAAPPLVTETKLTVTLEDVKSRKPITLYSPKAMYPQSPSYEDLFIDMEQIK